MIEFEYEGIKYRFDSQLCERRGGLVRLPNGLMLLVKVWDESAPPKPVVVEEVESVDAEIVSQ